MQTFQMLTWLSRYYICKSSPSCTHYVVVCSVSSVKQRKCTNSAVCSQAVIESVPLKQNIFADLEKYCKPTCLLASNTSTIDLGLIGMKTKSQDRIIGAHFFRFTCYIVHSILCHPCFNVSPKQRHRLNVLFLWLDSVPWDHQEAFE